MKTIGSRDNPIYKKARKLLKRKYRDAYGLYLLEGIKPLRDAISLGIEIEKIFEAEMKCREDILNGKLFMESDKLFHEAVARASHNKIFEQLMPLLHQSITIINYSMKDEKIKGMQLKRVTGKGQCRRHGGERRQSAARP